MKYLVFGAAVLSTAAFVASNVQAQEPLLEQLVNADIAKGEKVFKKCNRVIRFPVVGRTRLDQIFMASFSVPSPRWKGPNTQKL